MLPFKEQKKCTPAAKQRFKRYYKAHREEILAKRKERYANDPAYRQMIKRRSEINYLKNGGLSHQLLRYWNSVDRGKF